MKRFQKTAVFFMIAALMLSTAALASWKWPWQQTKNENAVSMQGSTTVLPIAQKAAEDFMKINKDIEVSVRGGGSGVGVAGIIDGACDIGMSSRSIKTGEIQKGREKGVNVTGTVVARDGMAIVVHPSNPLRGITIDQMKSIYTGKITSRCKCFRLRAYRCTFAFFLVYSRRNFSRKLFFSRMYYNITHN